MERVLQSHTQTMAGKLTKRISDLAMKVQKSPGEEMTEPCSDEATDVKWYMKPGLAVLGAVFGGVAGCLLGLAGVAGGIFIGAAVGIKLGARFGGGGKPEEKGIRKRRDSMDQPDPNL